MFIITQMYHVFLRHWREYAREGRDARAPWAGDADALGRGFARALDALERHRGERFPEFQERLVALMSEMQTFMKDHALIGNRRPAQRYESRPALCARPPAGPPGDQGTRRGEHR